MQKVLEVPHHRESAGPPLESRLGHTAEGGAPTPEVDFDDIAIRLIEQGYGFSALPVIEAAVAAIQAQSGDDSGLTLGELLDALRQGGHEDVVELIGEAVEYLRVHGAPATSPRAQASAEPPRADRFGPFRADPDCGAGVPRLRYEGAVTSDTVICSFAHGDDHGEMLRIMAPTVSYYAERHGMDAVLLAGPRIEPSRPASWDKVVVVRSLLEAYDTVIWIDADAIISDPGRDVREALHPDKPVHLVAHGYDGKVGPNLGIWIVQNDPRVLDLLEDMWASSEYTHHPWWEQAAFMDLIGYDPQDCSCDEFGPTPFSSLVGLLDVEWNSISLDAAEFPRIRHFAGEPPEDRLLGLQVEFGRFLARITAPGGVEREISRAAALPFSAAAPGAAALAGLPRREVLPSVLNGMGLTGVGVEVGVQRGLFSEHLLRRWKGKTLISVDPWSEDAPDAYVDISNVAQPEQERYYQETVERLAPFGERSDIWRTTSLEAAERIADGSLDFVYIDARHDFESAMEDLTAWFPKLRAGGVLAGHDYLDGSLPEGEFGVKSAVDRFFAERNLPVYATRRDGPWVSWVVAIPTAEAAN